MQHATRMGIELVMPQQPVICIKARKDDFYEAVMQVFGGF
jgi:hypothetical protein